MIGDWSVVEGSAMGVGGSGWSSVSKIPKPMPASARSRRTATLSAARRWFERRSARAMTGRTLTLTERRRMAVMSGGGRAGRSGRGWMVSGLRK